MALAALKNPTSEILLAGTISTLTGRDVVAVAPAPRKVDLPSAVALMRQHNAHFDAVVRNKGDFHRGMFQRADWWCRSHGLATKGSNARGLIGLLGVVGGFATATCLVISNGSPTLLAGLAGAGVALPMMMVRYPVAKLAALAESSAKRALRRQVQLDSVQPALQAFRASKGVEAALLGIILKTWFERMDQHRALSGPARVELMRANREVDALPESDRREARRLFELAKLVDAKGDVSASTVDAMVNEIQSASPDTRAALARDVVQLLEDNRRDVDYHPAHKLHELTLDQQA